VRTVFVVRVGQSVARGKGRACTVGRRLDSALNQREPQFNIAPTQKAPILAHADNGYTIKATRWGLVPPWAKDEKIGSNLINARVETAADKPSFRAAFGKRRCLLPASGYFEWKGEAGHKQPYFIHAPEGHALMFAGLWEGWSLTTTQSGCIRSRSSPANQAK
jgi:putative SOS response-associated peptidase YedK